MQSFDYEVLSPCCTKRLSNCFIFSQVRGAIKKSSIDGQIRNETQEHFSNRVAQILKSFDHQRINNLIDSMPRRVKWLNLVRGQRLKY